MREILFRGKRRDNREWVYGCYYKQTEFCGDKVEPFGIMIITSSESLCYDQALEYYAISEKTVGQFTGLTDKNGKKIFEGDIVRILGNQDVEDWRNVDYTALIAFIDGGFCAIDGTEEEHGFRRYALARFDFSLEVIGNIHDNPELLENP